MHKSAAWPLALVYSGLVVYASLYPFSEWRDQGIPPWLFLGAPIPHYWSAFDVAINVAGYAPLGALLALGALRTGRVREAAWVPTLAAALLSLLLEMLQSYLPQRVPSREDWVLNTSGAALGSVFIWILARLGAVEQWNHVRARWFVEKSRGAIVLLALWPLALLFPPSVPFGLGHVMERVELGLGMLLQATPFIEWLPMRVTELEPLVPTAEAVCVALGLLLPSLLAYCVIVSKWRRVMFSLAVLLMGICATALSAALSWGPAHAWAWADVPVQLGIALAALVAVLLALIPSRFSLALLLLLLAGYLGLLNQAPEGPYFSQTLQAWEQGRFIRFHGLAQWLGWLWPYAVLGYALSLLWQQDAKN